VATGKQKHGTPSQAGDEDATESSTEAGLVEQLKQKLKTEAGRDLYRRRKAIVEPVFGQIKSGVGSDGSCCAECRRCERDGN